MTDSYQKKPIKQKRKIIAPHYKHKQQSSNHNNKLTLRILKFLLKYSCILFLWAGTIISTFILYYIHDLPDVNSLQSLKKQRKITILAANNLILTNYGDLYSKYVLYDDIPKNIVNAVIATEDRRFFNHFGVDIIGIIRAFYSNYKAGYVVQGGSSITQQLAKIAFLSSDKTIKRKIQELVLALYLEHKFSKKEILTMYLNRVYLGAGIYGIDGAAKYYFGKKLKYINLYEASIIAGLLKAPSKYSPKNDIELSGERAYQVLLNMEDAGYITEGDIRDISNNPVFLETSALGSGNSLYFCDYVLDLSQSMIDDTDNDLIIKTTLNPSMQIKGEQVIKNYLTNNGAKLNIKQSSLIALANDGSILSMVGGRDYRESPFNRATMSHRQSGSAFKLFVFLNAIEQNNLSEYSKVNDSPISIGKWHPKNYTRHYLGEITLKEAFAKSINTVAVRLTESAGRENLIRLAKRLGINSDMKPHPSIALGIAEVSLIDLTSSFAIINNHGKKITPYAIKEIKTSKGKLLFKKINNQGAQVISNEAANIMKYLLREVVDNGTGKSARIDHKSTYGKTGTTQNYKDAWFVGFDDQITCGIWVGNDDNMAMNKVTGGGAPAIIWQEFMTMR
jgi:penicillin-binding protein 1A